MIIRNQQIAVFEADAQSAFENRMVEHLREYFPEPCEELGEIEVRRLIGYAIDKSAAYGIRSGRDVCLYTDVMFMFGLDFDTDATIPWAPAILNSELEPNRKAKVLFDTGLENLFDARGVRENSQI